MINALSAWLRDRVHALGVYLYDYLKARRDFRRARGSHHLQRLRDLDSEFSDLISEQADQLRRLEKQLRKTENLIRDRARDHAFEDLLKEELTGVRGIGSTLAERIRKQRVIDDPSSFRRRVGNVRGIGEEKAAALRGWMRRREDELEARTEALIEDRGAFPELHQDREDLVEAIEETEAERDRREMLRQEIRGAIDDLEATEPGDLVNLRRANDPGQELIAAADEYFLGLFAPWEQPPAWYRIAEDEVADAG